MTLTDNEIEVANITSTAMPNKLKMPVTDKVEVGQALTECLIQARDSGRLTLGLDDAGQLLETCPHEVMLCLLPCVEPSDVTLQIHVTLIQAFCWENDIRILKVDQADKLITILNEMRTNNNPEQQRFLGKTQFNCALIEYPTTQCSDADETVLEYHKVMSDNLPQPVLQLPG